MQVCLVLPGRKQWWLSLLDQQVPYISHWVQNTPRIMDRYKSRLAIERCSVVYLMPILGKDNTELRARKCIFLGYPERIKGSRLWCIEPGNLSHMDNWSVAVQNVHIICLFKKKIVDKDTITSCPTWKYIKLMLILWLMWEKLNYLTN